LISAVQTQSQTLTVDLLFASSLRLDALRAKRPEVRSAPPFGGRAAEADFDAGLRAAMLAP
jgi:hypothetical protein